MADTFSLVDAASLGDLKVLLGRSARLGCESVRLLGDSGVLAAYVAVLASRGLVDTSPTILGLRTFALADRDGFDVTVSIRALLDRLAVHSLTAAHGPGPMQVPLPASERPVAWAAVSPPRSGWQRCGEVSTSLLESTAAAGITEVANTLPESPGDSVAHRIRGQVWGRALPGVDIEVPAGSAFAAQALGFLVDEKEASVHQSGRWARVTTRRGHVLARVSG